MNDALRSEVSDALAKSGDDDVIGELTTVIADHLALGTDEELERFDELPDGLRIIWATWIVEADVLNGGFNQLYWNSTGAYAPAAAEAYRLLGVVEAAEVVEQSLEILDMEKDVLEQYWKAGTLEAFSESYKHTSLGTLDARLAELEERCQKARIEFVRSRTDMLLF